LVEDGVCGPKTWAEIDSFKPREIIVNVRALNVRSGPSTNYSIKTVIQRGSKHTLVYKKNNWGKLKDNFGWICLDYVK
jgi:uncharacterized protein YgiM (DUF1202 family)